jgi:hypothetical protein
MEGLGGGEAQGVLDPPPQKKKTSPLNAKFYPQEWSLPPAVKFVP